MSSNICIETLKVKNIILIKNVFKQFEAFEFSVYFKMNIHRVINLIIYHGFYFERNEKKHNFLVPGYFLSYKI